MMTANVTTLDSTPKNTLSETKTTTSKQVSKGKKGKKRRQSARLKGSCLFNKHIVDFIRFFFLKNGKMLLFIVGKKIHSLSLQT